MASGMVPSGDGSGNCPEQNLYTPAERESGKTAWLLGASFIAEGQFHCRCGSASGYPVLMVGSAVAGGMAMAFNLTLQAPHGGIFVMGLVNKPFYSCSVQRLAWLYLR